MSAGLDLADARP